MTLAQAIAAVAAVKPHAFTNDTVTDWINRLQLVVYDEIIKNHENTMIESEPDLLVHATDSAEELIIDEPYTQLYVLYCIAQIDYFTGDIGRYNNSMIAYNTLYQKYAAAFKRNHMPKQNHYIEV